jgi:cyclopropane-fatty-acyl-phospholipid synthase
MCSSFGLPLEIGVESAERAARVARTIVEALRPRFAVGLWNGERIGPTSGPVLKINDSEAIRALVRRPKLTTIVDLWMSKAFDVEDGSLFGGRR